jgi:hypothetical protein
MLCGAFLPSPGLFWVGFLVVSPSRASCPDPNLIYKPQQVTVRPLWACEPASSSCEVLTYGTTVYVNLLVCLMCFDFTLKGEC